jgi:hypothetical protein
MIYKCCTRSLRSITSVRHKPTTAVCKRSSLPHVVRGRRADNDVGAFGLEELRCVYEVGVVCLYGFGYATAEGQISCE